MAVGERAVAVFHSSETSYWYRSQWGGAEDVLEAVFESTHSVQPLLDVEWQPLGPRPLSDVDTLVDFHTIDAFYLVTPWALHVSLPLWFGLPLSDSSYPPTSGLFVPVSSLDGVRQCRRTVRELKGALIDAVRDGKITRDTAIDVLERTRRLIRTALVQFHPVPNIYIREREQGAV